MDLSSSLDPQIAGVRDDGSESGVLRAEIVKGELVPTPLPAISTYQEIGGTATASFQRSGQAFNTDGSLTGWNIVSSNSAGNYAALWFAFYGSTLGVRMRHDCGAFSVTVDGGDAVRVKNLEGYLAGESRQASANHDVATITHRDLGPGIHFGKIIFGQNVNGFINGIIVEKGPNNFPRTMRHTIQASALVAVPTSAATFNPYDNSMGSGYPFTSVSKVIYSNPTAGALTLTWSQSGTTSMSVSIPAGGIQIFDFPIQIGAGLFSHAASGSGMLVTAFGGYF